MGMPLPFATFLIFMTLKLLDKITWSWWLVTAPIWLWVLIYVVLGVLWEINKGKLFK